VRRLFEELRERRHVEYAVTDELSHRPGDKLRLMVELEAPKCCLHSAGEQGATRRERTHLTGVVKFWTLIGTTSAFEDHFYSTIN
jgi:hypothetical protein